MMILVKGLSEPPSGFQMELFILELFSNVEWEKIMIFKIEIF